MVSKRDVSIGQRIKWWRGMRRIKQNELAGQLGVTRQRLGDWERNGVPPYDSVLLRLAMRELQRTQEEPF